MSWLIRGGGKGKRAIIVLFMRNPMHSAARDKLQILKFPKEIVRLNREVARMQKL